MGTPAIALIGDVGGTNARFALGDLDQTRIHGLRIYHSHDFADSRSAIERFLEDSKLPAAPQVAVIAAAGPVKDGSVHMTNLNWTLSEDAFPALGIPLARLVNDFAALGLATPLLGPADLHQVGRVGSPSHDTTVAVIGPGTGFGACALVREQGKTVTLASEGGHASFAPGDDCEREILRILAGRFGHVSIERILSGQGLVNLHGALAECDGRAADDSDPALITQKALAGEEPYLGTVQRFCAILGSVAGDFALAYGATGGVFLAGGIAPRIRPLLDRSDFRARFEAKGRFAHYLRAIPTNVIVHTDTALLGALALAQQFARTTR